MCGIAGIVGLPRATSEPAIERMLAALLIRGPSGSGTRLVASTGEAPPVALAHARLAIIAPGPDGAQPMSGPEDQWLVYNGELYNFRELRRELQQLGAQLNGDSDSEVVLAAYRLWGPECRERLRGMFAMAVVDPRRRRLWLCRDRLGIKPLYLRHVPGGGLLFASSVTAMLAAGPELVPPQLDAEAIECFLAQGYVAGPQSIIAGVVELQPGSEMLVDWNGAVTAERRYWSPAAALARAEAAGASTAERPAAVAATAAVLRQAIRRHLVADVPLGVFLSSGVDSTVVAMTAARELGDPRRLCTVSLGFESGATLDESADAARIAAELGTEHRLARVSDEQARGDLVAFLAAMDQPTADGFNTFLVARAAREVGLTVALSGLGGDELFGGYATFRAARLASRLQPAQAALAPLARVLAAVLRRGPSGRAAAKLAAAFERPLSPEQVYFLRRELFLTEERRRLGALPPGAEPVNGMSRLTLARLAATVGLGVPTDDIETRVSLLELTTYMQGMLLRDADVFGMARAVEIRVPLLDDDLVEEVVRLPGAYKRCDPRLKPLLIDAAGGALPAAVGRKKRGFKLPWEEWLRGPLRPWTEERIGDREVWRRAGLDGDAAADLLRRFAARDARVSATQVLALATLADFIGSRRLYRSH